MLRESHRPGIEPATCKSQVQRPTAEPPRNGNFRDLQGELAHSNCCDINLLADLADVLSVTD